MPHINPNPNPNLAIVTLVPSTHRGRQQWNAESIPPHWQQGECSEIRRIVVNFPPCVAPLVGEQWVVKRFVEKPGLLFVNAVAKAAAPEGFPNWFEAGAEIVVTDEPDQGGNRYRRRGRLRAFSWQICGRQQLLVIHLDELTYELIERVPGSRLQPHASHSLQFHDLHEVDGDLYAYHGRSLVQLYRS